MLLLFNCNFVISRYRHFQTCLCLFEENKNISHEGKLSCLQMTLAAISSPTHTLLYLPLTTSTSTLPMSPLVRPVPVRRTPAIISSKCIN